jgi:hypothetical protein
MKTSWVEYGLSAFLVVASLRGLLEDGISVTLIGWVVVPAAFWVGFYWHHHWRKHTRPLTRADKILGVIAWVFTIGLCTSVPQHRLETLRLTKTAESRVTTLQQTSASAPSQETSLAAQTIDRPTEFTNIEPIDVPNVSDTYDVPLTFASKIGDVYTFSRSDLIIKANCDGGSCTLTGVPGTLYHEDISRNCDGYKDGEIRYGLQQDLKYLWLMEFHTQCRYSKEGFMIIAIKHD